MRKSTLDFLYRNMMFFTIIINLFVCKMVGEKIDFIVVHNIIHCVREDAKIEIKLFS